MTVESDFAYPIMRQCLWRKIFSGVEDLLLLSPFLATANKIKVYKLRTWSVVNQNSSLSLSLPSFLEGLRQIKLLKYANLELKRQAVMNSGF